MQYRHETRLYTLEEQERENLLLPADVIHTVVSPVSRSIKNRWRISRIDRVRQIHFIPLCVQVSLYPRRAL